MTNFKRYVLVFLSCLALVLLTAARCAAPTPSPSPSQNHLASEAEKQLCTAGGGTVVTRDDACKAIATTALPKSCPTPNTIVGCTADKAIEADICDCGSDKCWNGQNCSDCGILSVSECLTSKDCRRDVSDGSCVSRESICRILTEKEFFTSTTRCIDYAKNGGTTQSQANCERQDGIEGFYCYWAGLGCKLRNLVTSDKKDSCNQTTESGCQNVEPKGACKWEVGLCESADLKYSCQQRKDSAGKSLCLWVLSDDSQQVGDPTGCVSAAFSCPEYTAAVYDKSVQNACEADTRCVWTKASATCAAK